ncbi:hypothetical protein ACLOJK_005046 [Asimina triloba]
MVGCAGTFLQYLVKCGGDIRQVVKVVKVMLASGSSRWESFEARGSLCVVLSVRDLVVWIVDSNRIRGQESCWECTLNRNPVSIDKNVVALTGFEQTRASGSCRALYKWKRIVYIEQDLDRHGNRNPVADEHES